MTGVLMSACVRNWRVAMSEMPFKIFPLFRLPGEMLPVWRQAAYGVKPYLAMPAAELMPER
jgi:hypothetical protein